MRYFEFWMRSGGVFSERVAVCVCVPVSGLMMRLAVAQ